jgi:pilus assembly protein Flp/PilA
MKKFTQRFLRDNKGVTAIEYGLIAGLIALAISAAVIQLSGNLTAAFNAIAALIVPAA